MVEANCRYRAPARYDDVLTLETRVLNQRTSMIRFGYRLLREIAGKEPVLLAEGETVHVVVDRAMQKTRCRSVLRRRCVRWAEDAQS